MINIPLNEKQQFAFDTVKKGDNLFITGAAGTGKSFLINHLKEHLDVDVTASTGIAATNIGGQTLHSWAGMYPFGNEIRHTNKPKTLYRISQCSTLVIDEISMVDDLLLDYLDMRLRKVNYPNRFEPFGGIQVIAVGDFMQLPPINPKAGYCFNSSAWRQADFQHVKLTHVERQKEKRMADFLDSVRFKKFSTEDHTILRNIASNSEFPDDYVKLYARNRECDMENEYRLAQIDDEVVHCEAEVNITKPEHVGKHVEYFFKGSLIGQEIYMKVGARVMMLANDHLEEGISNGSIGTISEFSQGDPVVKFDDGQKIRIEKKKIPIQIKNPDTREPMTVAEISQYPLRLSWAITIHKSQGMTLERVGIDFQHIFAPFQAYVALSRCSNLETLRIKNMRLHHIRLDDEAVEFMTNL